MYMDTFTLTTQIVRLAEDAKRERETLVVDGAIDITQRFNLPELPTADVVLHARVLDPSLRRALRTFVAGVRSAGTH